MKKIKKIYVVVIVFVLSLGLNGIVHALPCGIGSVDGGGAPYACSNGVLGDNNVTAADLNAGIGYFESTDWLFLQKNETPGPLETGAFDLALDVSPDANVASGTWKFGNSPWGTYEDILIVLKDGRINVQGGSIWYAAYLVDDGDISGNWDTGGRGLSHLSVYGRGDATNPVPEPSTMILLGSGLLGAGLYRRKKFRK